MCIDEKILILCLQQVKKHTENLDMPWFLVQIQIKSFNKLFNPLCEENRKLFKLEQIILYS